MNILIRNACAINLRRLTSINYQFSKVKLTTSSNDITTSKDEIEENEKAIYNRVDKSYQQYINRRVNETVEVKRARLLYQSHKRGTSENGILLANFAKKYLPQMKETQLDEYDKIISSLYNEWDIYYW